MFEGNPDHDPWSIRRTAIYQRYNDDSGKIVFLLIAPSEIAKVRLETEIALARRSGIQPNAFGLHLLLISALQDNWRPYIRRLEHILRDEVCI
jgi:hypothetical protein